MSTLKQFRKFDSMQKVYPFCIEWNFVSQITTTTEINRHNSLHTDKIVIWNFIIWLMNFVIIDLCHWKWLCYLMNILHSHIWKEFFSMCQKICQIQNKVLEETKSDYWENEIQERKNPNRMLIEWRERERENELFSH